MGYIFDTKKGETAADVKKRRELAKALALRAAAPARDIPSGISALASGIASGIHGHRARTGQEAIDKRDTASMDALIDAQTGTYAGPEAAAATTPTQSGSFNERLAQSESGGKYSARNAEGFSGKYQFGQPRLDDYNRVKGTKYTTDDLLQSPELQEAVQGWHVGDIDAFIQSEGLDKYVGQSVGGVPVTVDGMRAMAHLGGKGGMKKFLQSGGKYNPADSNGTRLRDYAQKFAGASPAGQQMAAALRGGPPPGAIGGPAIPVRPPGPHGIAVPPTVQHPQMAQPPQAPPQAAVTPTAGPAPQMPVPQPQQAIPARLRAMRAFDEDYQGPGSIPQSMQGVVGANPAPPMRSPQMTPMGGPTPAMRPVPPQGGPTPITPQGYQPPAAIPPGGDAAARPVQYDAPQSPGRPQRGTERDRQIYAQAMRGAHTASDPRDRQMFMQAAKTAYERFRPLTNKEMQEERMGRIQESTARLGMTNKELANKKLEAEMAGNMPMTLYQKQQLEAGERKQSFTESQAGLTPSLKEFEAFQKMTPDQQKQFLATKKAGAASTEITMPGEKIDAWLLKSLDTKTGEVWQEYLKAGANAVSQRQDMEVLELLQNAPQGPLVGRLAERFPGFSSKAALFNSVVKRLAPTMRAVGSGSTSDVEYGGMLQSMPQLMNKPGANSVIIAVIKSKAEINIRRRDVIHMVQDRSITASEGRKRIREIDSESILTPEIRAMFVNLDGGAAKNDNPALDDALKQYVR